MPSPSFHLSKWYLDAVDENGRAFIGYAGEISWKGLRAPYVSLLIHNGSGVETSEFRMHHLSMPEHDEGKNTLSWEDARFGISGKWAGTMPPLSVRLFENAEGRVDWRCFFPQARAALIPKNGAPLNGWGYAEQLEITCLPWQIPLGQLRWGRFLSEKYCLVWIEWRMDSPRQWVFLNGVAVKNALVSDDAVALPERRIRLVLDRSGKLAAGKKILQIAGRMLSVLPGFKQSAPARFLYADERKWRSRGLLYEKDTLAGEGWAVHELVDFTGKG